MFRTFWRRYKYTAACIGIAVFVVPPAVLFWLWVFTR